MEIISFEMESHVIGITDSTLLLLEISDSNISIHDLCAQLPLTNTFPLTFQDSESCRDDGPANSYCPVTSITHNKTDLST